MAFNTNLQQALAYLKNGHAVLPPARPATPYPQFAGPRVAPAMTPPMQAGQPQEGQPVQGIMPQTAPPVMKLR